MFYEVIIDHGETANKCTIVPLNYRADFRIRRVGPNLPAFAAPILLHHEGVCLTEITEPVTGIAVIDSIWRRLPVILQAVPAPLPKLVRIPDGFVTAYPRRSKDGSDPSGGLATIEALFIASALLGNWDESLLREYYFGVRFLDANMRRFAELGVTRPAVGRLNGLKRKRPRSSLQRRLDRGRVAPVYG